VFGGQAPKAIRSVEQYDFLQDMWTPMVDMPSRRCRCGQLHLITTVTLVSTQFKRVCHVHFVCVS
jgi:hypothetical protein